jgi:hypothetical protein
MDETTVSGASDDLIEVEGSVREELYANYSKPTYFRVGNWKFEAEYDGEWHFAVIDHPNGVMWTHLGIGESDEHRDYSEVIRFDCPSGVRVEKVDSPK